jgi:ABC-type molybdate transport system substrate-binding protein
MVCRVRFIAGAALLLAVAGMVPAARAAEAVRLNVFAAGTLAQPFRALVATFQHEYPNVVVQPQFGSASV